MFPARGVGAVHRGEHFLFVHVTELMHSKSAGRIDLRVHLVPRWFIEPLRPLVSHQQADIVARRPGRSITLAHGVKLTHVPRQPALVIACVELQEGRVEPQHADTVAAG
jgi:hypothetical protein